MLPLVAPLIAGTVGKCVTLWGMSDERPTVQVNLRLSRAELEAVDRVRPATVPRTHWIRGAVRLRLGLGVGEEPRRG